MEESGYFPDQESYSTIPEIRQGSDNTELLIEFNYTGNQAIDGLFVLTSMESNWDVPDFTMSDSMTSGDTFSESIIIPYNIIFLTDN